VTKKRPARVTLNGVFPRRVWCSGSRRVQADIARRPRVANWRFGAGVSSRLRPRRHRPPRRLPRVV
jgi:hypothetical protein